MPRNVFHYEMLDGSYQEIVDGQEPKPLRHHYSVQLLGQTMSPWERYVLQSAIEAEVTDCE
jgi:hypothetical protein